MPQLDPDASARETLRLIGPDPQNWVPEREGVDHNVLVIGGGESGSTFSFALRRAGIGKVSVIGVDLAARPELSDFAHEILLWRDRFTAAEEERDDVLAVYPYLGTGHEYLEKCRGLLPT
jgi:hypothetical protein